MKLAAIAGAIGAVMILPVFPLWVSIVGLIPVIYSLLSFGGLLYHIME